MKSDIVLRSMNKGYISMHLWSCIWSIVFIYIGGRLADIGDATQNAHVFFFSAAGVYILGTAVAIIFIFNLYAAAYGARDVVILSHGNDGFLGKLVITSYGFPFSVNRRQVSFNRIVEIEVDQSSIDRTINMGSLSLKLVTFTNAQAIEESITIYAISNPHGIKSLIEKSLPDHEGLMIKK